MSPPRCHPSDLAEAAIVLLGIAFVHGLILWTGLHLLLWLWEGA